MIDQLIAHLKKSHFRPIIDVSKETHSIKALKLMCVIDFHVDQKGLYEKMKSHPRLLEQLLQFYSYEAFKYYNYKPNQNVQDIIGAKVMRCKLCKLIGPYVQILIHMAITHGQHIGLKKCAYCMRQEITSDSHSMENCCRKHLDTYEIDENSDIIFIVDEFYNDLKQIATDLDVIILRKDDFTGTGYAKKETVQKKIVGFPKMCTVFTAPKSSPKTVKVEALDELFMDFVEKRYGGNGLSRLLNQEEDVNTDDEDVDGSSGFNNMNTVTASHSMGREGTKQISCLDIESILQQLHGGKSANVSSSMRGKGTKRASKKMDTRPEPFVKTENETKVKTEPSNTFFNYLAQRMDRVSEEKRKKLEDKILQLIILDD
ncbi:uncharacterized protein LOC116341249 isoform X2 [Contarinia nasturtii]|uniref:uncharacterized protein LOC116341249 isoform X2 n=1 Tax=Contarinia nasturtii TaxID=265458 RepID=UPI0012D4615F|nr:uncharacterized protein LOC116341249 isoform X2 [Contarinia nasturtii]